MKTKIGIISMALGIVCILGAAGLVTYNYLDEKRVATESADVSQQLIEQMILTSNSDTHEISEENDDDSWVETMPVMSDESGTGGGYVSAGISVGADTYVGILEIPSLKLSLAVNETWDMAKLRRTPCRYWGSAENNNMVIAAHNYRNHFGRITSLSYGDSIVFTSADGTTYNYEVAEFANVGPEEVENVVLNEFDITLFTCNYDGGERIVVRGILSE